MLSTSSVPIGVNVSYLQNTKLSRMHIFFKTRTTATLQVNSFLVTHSLLVTTCILNYGTSAVVSHSQLIFRDRVYTYTLCMTLLFQQSHKVSVAPSTLGLFNEQ